MCSTIADRSSLLVLTKPLLVGSALRLPYTERAWWPKRAEFFVTVADEGGTNSRETKHVVVGDGHSAEWNEWLGEL